MSVPSARAKLKDSHRMLLLAWEQATEHWNDPVSEAFYRQHLEPLEQTLRGALNAMDAAHEVLQRVQRECSEVPA